MQLQQGVLEILHRRVAIRVLESLRGITHGVVRVEPRALVAPVELVEPDAFEQIVLYARVSRRLVQAAEFHVGCDPRRDIEDIERGIRSSRDRKQRIVGNARRKVLSKQCRSQVIACLKRMCAEYLLLRQGLVNSEDIPDTQ